MRTRFPIFVQRFLLFVALFLFVVVLVVLVGAVVVVVFCFFVLFSYVIGGGLFACCFAVFCSRYCPPQATTNQHHIKVTALLCFDTHNRPYLASRYFFKI